MKRYTFLLFCSLCGLALVAWAIPRGLAAADVESLPSEDTYVSGYLPSQNYGDATSLDAGYYGVSTEYEYWALLKFNFAARPANYTRCVLKLYASVALGNSPSMKVNVTATTDGWTETTVTWNNRPTAILSTLGQFTITDSNSLGYQTIDVTDFVNALIAIDPSQNLSICVRPADLSYNRKVGISSKEHQSVPSKVPLLVWEVPQTGIAGYDVITLMLCTLAGMGCVCLWNKFRRKGI